MAGCEFGQTVDLVARLDLNMKMRCSILQLPTELHTRIAYYLLKSEMISLMSCCSGLNSAYRWMLYDNLKFDIVLNESYEPSSAMAMIESLASAYYIPSRSMAFRIRSDSDKIIPNRVEHIKSIIFRILSKIPEGYLETLELAVPWSLDDGFGSVISSHRNLTSLNICAQDFRRKTHPEHAETADLIEWKFPCLENLHLDFPRTNYGVSITSSILRSAPQLSRIHIQFRSFQEASVNFSDLLQSLANQNPRDLYLGGIDLNSLRAKYWNRWTNFAISDCQNISSIVPLTSRRYLKRLTIQGWRTQTLEVAGILNNLQPGLEGLSLVLNNDTDEEIADSAINDEILLKHQHSLKSLHIDVPKYRDCFSQVLLLRQFKEISEFGLAIDSDQITLEFIVGCLVL
ncbi:hypothetical protein TWF751_002439 [Orbilia oligospora]|nr:hypothetical protein TWF751_002439 [Orbilia oligospora]